MSAADDSVPIVMSESRLSVIICTHNPNLQLLSQAIDSIVNQTLSPTSFELIVVDNNSAPAIDADFLKAWDNPARLVRERKQGLVHARVKGISEAEGQLLVFVDDDNRLAPDYLETATSIAANHPETGAIGGVVTADPPIELARWKLPFLPYLAIRDYGPEPITSFQMRPGPWDPIGAGMVVRRSVGERYASMVGQGGPAAELGRSGTSLLSHSDILMARCANLEGLACSYQPSLRLKHHVDGARLKWRYLSRLMEANGRSYVKLERALGHQLKSIPSGLLGHMRLFAIYAYYSLTRGRSGFVRAWWHKGYLSEYRRPPNAPIAETIQS